MTTAAELADKFEAGSWSGFMQAEIIRELRRIADLERRALTDGEVAALKQLHSHLPNSTVELESILARIAPSPPIEWTEPVPGVHVAACNGWSLCVMPVRYMKSGVRGWIWRSSRVECDGGASNNDLETIDAAKSAAVKWAIENWR